MQDSLSLLVPSPHLWSVALYLGTCLKVACRPLLCKDRRTWQNFFWNWSAGSWLANRERERELRIIWIGGITFLATLASSLWVVHCKPAMVPSKSYPSSNLVWNRVISSEVTGLMLHFWRWEGLYKEWTAALFSLSMPHMPFCLSHKLPDGLVGRLRLFGNQQWCWSSSLT